MDVAIRAGEPDDAAWFALRRAMFPDCPDAEHRQEMAAFCAQPRRYAQFVAEQPDGVALGFVEVALRSDYVNGTSTSPVAFLEALFVVPSARRRGVARALVTRARAWARERGCAELASDAPLENTASHAMHRALGFEETERVVYFRQSL